jgi:hypothetical protein
MAGVASAPVVRAGHMPLLFLDANVLLPTYLRAVFLDLADAALVRVHWSRQVLAEVRRNLSKPRFGLSHAAIERLFDDLAAAFPDALIDGSETLESRFLGKTDSKDVHVAAGALKLSQAVSAGQPVLLVTSNIRHFPATAFAGTLVHPIRPGPFLLELLSAQPRVADVIDAMRKRFKSPPVSRTDLLTILDASNCRSFATALGKSWGLAPQN